MLKKYIIAYCSPHSGLCNRLNCIISAMHGGEMMEREVLIYWPRGYNCDIPLEDLIKINSAREIQKKEFRKIKGKLKVHNYDFETIPEEKFLLLNTSKIQLFNEKNLAEEESINDLLKKINVKEDILEKFNELNKLYDFQSLIGVHIRSGDWRYTSYGIVNISPEEDFEKEIRKILKKNPTQKFLLCTGSKEVESKFIEKFEKSIVIIPKHSQEFKDPNYKGGPTQIKEALIDLLSLSNTKSLLGTWGSSFTEMAWRLSGNKESWLKVIGSEKKKEIEKIRELEVVSNFFVSKVIAKISSELSARFSLFRRLKFFIRSKRLKRRSA